MARPKDAVPDICDGEPVGDVGSYAPDWLRIRLQFLDGRWRRFLIANRCCGSVVWNYASVAERSACSNRNSPGGKALFPPVPVVMIPLARIGVALPVSQAVRRLHVLEPARNSGRTVTLKPRLVTKPEARVNRQPQLARWNVQKVARPRLALFVFDRSQGLQKPPGLVLESLSAFDVFCVYGIDSKPNSSFQPLDGAACY
jgi:hypothetical protein